MSRYSKNLSEKVKRSMAAKKSARTRQARKEFANKYPYTANMVQSLKSGYSSREVALIYGVTLKTVATVKANLNRPCSFSKLAEQCNF